MSPYIVPDQPRDDHAAFINEAQRNLLLLGAVSGPDSAHYDSLVRCYRDVADQLGCRQQFERVLALIGRQEGQVLDEGDDGDVFAPSRRAAVGGRDHDDHQRSPDDGSDRRG